MFRYFTHVIVVLLALPVVSAAAHSPYYTQTERLSWAGDSGVEIKLLHGDGIFFADPIRAVVVDKNGKLLAASPLSITLFIFCSRSNGRSDCIAYDELRQLIYTPNRSSTQTTQLLEIDGKPQEYPEYQMEGYGFDTRHASFFEIIKFEALSVFRWPLLTVFAIAWWLIVWALVTPLFWRLKGNQWRLGEVSFASVLLVLSRLIAALALILIAAYSWLLFPYSLVYLMFVTLVGATLALVLTRPKQWS